MNTVSTNVVKKYQDFIAAICLIATIGFFCWKAPYSFGAWDESWYLTFAHRFSMGDSMVVDEWNIIQLFSIFLYLPFKIYTFFFSSTEGIILFFRYLFILFQSAISAAIYVLLRKYGSISIFALLIISLFVPASMMAVCYYSLITAISAIIGLLLSANKFKKTTLIMVGILFACIVLCNPFLALIYFLYCFSVIIYTIRRKLCNNNLKLREEYFSIKTWFLITSGIGAVTLIFIVFLLSGTTVHEIIVNLPHVFEDSEYNIFNRNGKIQNIIDVKQSILEIININPHLLTAYFILLTAIVFDKNRIRHRLHYLIAVSAIVTGLTIYLICTSDFYNYLLCMFPLTLLGLVSYILSKNKDKKVFIFMWVWGIIIAFFEDISSNQGTRLMSVGLATSVLASIVLTKNLINEIENNIRSKKKNTNESRQSILVKKVSFSIFVIVLLAQIGFECYVNADLKTMSAEYFYNDLFDLSSTAEELDVKIPRGPAKGLITTKKTADLYENILVDLSNIKDRKKEPVLILGLFPWSYLYVSNPYATYTTKDLIEKWPEKKVRLLDYYKLHPEKKPVYIYIPKKGSLFVFDNRYDEYVTEQTNVILSDIKKEFHCNVTEGCAGYMIKILD